MKRIIAIIVCVLGCALFGVDDPTKAYVEFWDGFEKDGDTTLQIGGVDYTFKNGHFTSSHKTIDEALQKFSSTYTSLLASMLSQPGAMKANQADYNMAIWTEQMTAEMYDGIAEQQRIDAERIEELNDGTEDVAEQVAELTKSTGAHIQDLKGSLDGKLASVTEGNTALIGQLTAAVAAKTQELDQKIEDLKANKNADNATVSALKELVTERGLDIAANKKAIEELRKSNKSIASKYASIEEKLLTLGTHTNEMKRISRWLGYDEGVGGDNPGIFKKPLKPDESEYGETDNVLNYLDDYEMVGYSSISNQSMSVYPMRYCFAEQIDGDDTNVVSSFTAAKNWADGKTVICTNGMYSVHPDIQFLTNIVWATNWTEAVKHITKEETTNIVNVVTNLVNDYNTITTQVYKVEAFTNWYNMVNWTTNFILKVETNTNEIVDWTTNFVTVTSAITNKKEFVSFQTNVFNHSTFVTNTIENLRTIQNWTFVTNHIIRYLGGGQEGGETPTIDPKDDPYSPNYEPQPIDDYIIPTKNARLISAITNYPLSKINSDNLFDKKSIWTNNHLLAEIKGYWKAKKDQFPYKPADGDDVEIKWADFPWAATNTVDITTNDIDKVKKWLKKIEEKNIFNIVWTNANSLAELKTNFFNKVNAEDMLDNKSVWTNGNKLVEIKGFHKAEGGTHPVVNVDPSTGERSIRWDEDYTVDSEATKDIYMSEALQCRSIESSEDFMYPTNNVLSIYGFLSANENTVPYKTKVGNNYEIQWRDVGYGCFAIHDGELINRYYNVGGKTYMAGSRATSPGKVLCLMLSHSSSVASYVEYNTIEDMMSAQNDLSTYIMPLYEFNSDGSVKRDFRISLNAVMMEY